MAAGLGSGITKLIRVPGVSAFVDLAEAIAAVRGWLHHLRGNLRRDTDALLTTTDEVKTYLREVGFARFNRYWHYGRQLISLQHRLLVEQVFSDLGPPWSEFVTGFGVLKGIEASISDEYEEVNIGGINVERRKRQDAKRWYRSGGGGR